MGYRLHYADKYDVQWVGGWFSWQKGIWDEFVREYLPSTWQSRDGDGEDYEIDVDELEEAIEELRKKPKKKNEHFTDYTNEQVADILEEMLSSKTAKKEGYVRLTWF